MVPDYVAMAGPAFVLLIGVELFVAWRRGQQLYRLNDAVNDIATGMIQQLSTLFTKGLLIAGYLWIFADLRLFELSAASPWTWVAGFLAVDLAYYWFHRLSHEINFLWAAHLVHHQSEDFNLAVALRQSTLQPVFGSVFYWPLALAGIPPAVFLTCSAFNTLYQFWLHTQTIRSLGPLEEVLVTPSHHRVHHGRNPIYLDRNHGGTFIVWDRLFGTFQREQEEVVYGITKPLESWNPVWANLHYWVELFRTARAARRPIDKLRTFVAPPGWVPADLGGPEPPPEVSSATPKFDRAYPAALVPHAVFQFAVLIAATIALANTGSAHPLALQAAGVAGIVWGLLNLGGLFEGRAWALDSEIARLVAAPALALAFGWGPAALSAVALYAVGSLAFGWRLLRGRAARGASTDAGGEAIC
jgi:sterol desaturase/sphingolipid hydroxylase (fatty acid hydroxylase superfamily)